jgi:hypothetical protein
VSAVQSTERADVFGLMYADVWRVASQSISAQNSFQPSGNGTRILSTQTAVASCKIDMCLAAVMGHVYIMSSVSCHVSTAVGHELSLQCVRFGFFVCSCNKTIVLNCTAVPLLSNIVPPHLKHLSHRGTNFSVLCR